MPQEIKKHHDIVPIENPIVAGEEVELSIYGSTGNLGDEDFKQKDLTYGFLRYTQTNSHVAMKGHAKFIPGLEAGNFYSTLNNEKLGEKIRIIYLKYFRSYTEYSGQKGNGVFVRSIPEYEFESLKSSGELVYVEGDTLRLKNGNYVSENLNYMVLVDKRPDLGVLRFQLGVGSIKQAQKWNSLIDTSVLPNGRKAPKWAYVWELGLSLDQDKKGNTFWNIGSSGKVNATKVELVRGDQLENVIKFFTFFQQTRNDHIDNAEQSHYDDSESESNPL